MAMLRMKCSSHLTMLASPQLVLAATEGSSPAFSMCSPRPFPCSLLFPPLPMMEPSKIQFLLWHGAGNKCRNPAPCFFSAKCHSCSLLALFPVCPCWSPRPFAHSQLRGDILKGHGRRCQCQNSLPRAGEGPEGSSLVPAPPGAAGAGCHGAGHIPFVRTHHHRLQLIHACAPHKPGQGFWGNPSADEMLFLVYFVYSSSGFKHCNKYLNRFQQDLLSWVSQLLHIPSCCVLQSQAVSEEDMAFGTTFSPFFDVFLLDSACDRLSA